MTNKSNKVVNEKPADAGVSTAAEEAVAAAVAQPVAEEPKYTLLSTFDEDGKDYTTCEMPITAKSKVGEVAQECFGDEASRERLCVQFTRVKGGIDFQVMELERPAAIPAEPVKEPVAEPAVLKVLNRRLNSHPRKENPALAWYDIQVGFARINDLTLFKSKFEGTAYYVKWITYKGKDSKFYNHVMLPNDLYTAANKLIMADYEANKPAESAAPAAPATQESPKSSPEPIKTDLNTDISMSAGVISKAIYGTDAQCLCCPVTVFTMKTGKQLRMLDVKGLRFLQQNPDKLKRGSTTELSEYAEKARKGIHVVQVFKKRDESKDWSMDNSQPYGVIENDAFKAY